MKRLSRDAKIDAYNMTIDYLRTEECVYDPQGDYKAARIWLAEKLDREVTHWMSHLKDEKKPA